MVNNSIVTEDILLAINEDTDLGFSLTGDLATYGYADVDPASDGTNSGNVTDEYVFQVQFNTTGAVGNALLAGKFRTIRLARETSASPRVIASFFSNHPFDATSALHVTRLLDTDGFIYYELFYTTENVGSTVDYTLYASSITVSGALESFTLPVTTNPALLVQTRLREVTGIFRTYDVFILTVD